MAWREGVFDREEISAAHPAHAYARVQGPSGSGAKGQGAGARWADMAAAADRWCITLPDGKFPRTQKSQL